MLAIETRPEESKYQLTALIGGASPARVLADPSNDREFLPNGRENLKRFVRFLRGLEEHKSANIDYHVRKKDSLSRTRPQIDFDALYAVDYKTLFADAREGLDECRLPRNDEDIAPPRLSSRKLRHALAKHAESIEQLVRERSELRDLIRRLNALAKQANPMPVYPDLRQRYFFRYGDSVAVYAFSPAFHRSQNRWVRGIVLSSYGEDGAVVRLDQPLLKGRLGSNGEPCTNKNYYTWKVEVPELIMLETDYNFLAKEKKEKEDSPFVKQWFRRIIRYGDYCLHDDATHMEQPLSVRLLMDTFASGPLGQCKNALMSGKEALSVFRLSAYPTTREDAVGAFLKARRRNRHSNLDLVNAKGTLLVRIGQDEEALRRR